MSVILLSRRLRKAESRNKANCGPRFFIWTRESDAADEIIASPPDPKPATAMTVVCAGRMTRSRWPNDAMLLAIEMEAIIEHAAGGPMDTFPPGTARDPRVAVLSDDELLAAIIEQGFSR